VNDSLWDSPILGTIFRLLFMLAFVAFDVWVFIMLVRWAVS